MARGASQVLVEDLLLQLLERPQGLLARALQDAAIDAGHLSAALQPRSENSASRNPVFAPELVQWLQDALLVASLELGQTQIDQAALILALLRNPLRYAGAAIKPCWPSSISNASKALPCRNKRNSPTTALRRRARRYCRALPTTSRSRRGPGNLTRCCAAMTRSAR